MYPESAESGRKVTPTIIMCSTPYVPLFLRRRARMKRAMSLRRSRRLQRLVSAEINEEQPPPGCFFRRLPARGDLSAISVWMSFRYRRYLWRAFAWKRLFRTHSQLLPEISPGLTAWRCRAETRCGFQPGTAPLLATDSLHHKDSA